MDDLIYVSAIMLAAGRSDRMGERNKLLLSWGQKTVLEASLAPFCALPFGEIVVVTGYEHDRIAEMLAAYPVRLVRNDEYRQGLSASIRAGVAAATQPGAFLFGLGDMPMIRADSVRRVCEAFLTRTQPSIVRPVYDGRGGHPVLLSRDYDYEAELLQQEGDAGARAILQRHRDALFEVKVDDAGIVTDFDTTDDYASARKARQDHSWPHLRARSGGGGSTRPGTDGAV